MVAVKQTKTLTDSLDTITSPATHNNETPDGQEITNSDVTRNLVDEAGNLSPEPVSPPKVVEVGYDQIIRPQIFEKHCQSCHNASTPALNWLDFEVVKTKKAAFYARVIEPHVNPMPPAFITFSAYDRWLFKVWLDADLPKDIKTIILEEEQSSPPDISPTLPDGIGTSVSLVNGISPGVVSSTGGSSVSGAAKPHQESDGSTNNLLTAEHRPTYVDDIRPQILEKVCNGCHNKSMPFLNWLEYDVIKTRKPALYDRVFGNAKNPMPPMGYPFLPQDKALLKAWLDLGMPQTRSDLPAENPSPVMPAKTDTAVTGNGDNQKPSNEKQATSPGSTDEQVPADKKGSKSDQDNEVKAENVTFENFIKPQILEKTCKPCHNPGNPVMNWLDYDTLKAKQPAFYERVIRKTRVMPPAYIPFDERFRQIMQDWLDAGMPRGTASGTPSANETGNETGAKSGDDTVKPEEDNKPGADDDSNSDANKGGSSDFEPIDEVITFAELAPLLFNPPGKCAVCHNATSPSENYIPNFANYDVAFALRQEIGARVLGGKQPAMPMGDVLTISEKQMLKSWLDNGACKDFPCPKPSVPTITFDQAKKVLQDRCMYCHKQGHVNAPILDFGNEAVAKSLAERIRDRVVKQVPSPMPKVGSMPLVEREILRKWAEHVLNDY